MNRLDAYQLFHAGTLALAEVERRGIHIDIGYCDEKLKWIDSKFKQAERRFYRTPLGRACLARFGDGFKYSSVQQLRAVLGADFGVKPIKETEGGEASADEESLRRCGVEGAELVLRMRRLSKMGNTLSGLRREAINGVIHPSFWLHTVATYRSSSSGPNLQNVPVRDFEMQEVCRTAILPSKGHRLLEIDFKSVEVAVAACLHQDPTMLVYLRDPKSDMHGDMAVQIYKLKDGARQAENFKSVLRQSAKNGFVFPEFYGDYYGSCAVNMACNWLKMPQDGSWRDSHGATFDGVPIGAHLRDIGIHSLGDFTDHLEKVERDFWERRFRVYNRWRKDWYAKYQNEGGFEMKTGFSVSGLYSRNQVINFPVQGPAFHCLLWVLIRLVNRLRGRRSGVIAEVHDSALIDAHPDEFDDVLAICRELVEALKCEWDWLIAPMTIEAKAGPVDGSWAVIEELD